MIFAFSYLFFILSCFILYFFKKIHAFPFRSLYFIFLYLFTKNGYVGHEIVTRSKDKDSIQEKSSTKASSNNEEVPRKRKGRPPKKKFRGRPSSQNTHEKNYQLRSSKELLNSPSYVSNDANNSLSAVTKKRGRPRLSLMPSATSQTINAHDNDSLHKRTRYDSPSVSSLHHSPLDFSDMETSSYPERVEEPPGNSSIRNPFDQSISKSNPLLCIICVRHNRHQNRSIIFMPCEHMLVCKLCSEVLSYCPKCGDKVNEKQEIS